MDHTKSSTSSTPPVLRVLVIDHSDHVRRAICELLKSQSDIKIICEGSNGRDAVDLAKEHRPDLVLLDITMPLINGFDAARLIKHERVETHILMMSQFNSQAFRREAFAAGASGYVVKDKAASDLIPEVRRITGLAYLADQDS